MSETKKKESTGNDRYSLTTVGVEVQITYLKFKVILCLFSRHNFSDGSYLELTQQQKLCAFVFVSESIQTDRILTIESL